MVNMKILVGFIVLVAMMILIIALEETGGETIIVAQDGNGDYEKIQWAIDNASSGDTIRVFEGSYCEKIIVFRKVNLIGNGSDITNIDGEGEGDVIKITADYVSISGFSIRNSGDTWKDAGIRMESDYNEITNNSCSQNYVGIHLEKSKQCTITNNSCTNNDGAGISLKDTYEITITNNTCSSNNDDGIRLRDSHHCILTDNTLKENGITIFGILWDWFRNDIAITNTVNGKPVHFLKNVTDSIVPEGAGQVIMANCSEITVENQNCSNGSIGILIGYSSNITLDNITSTGNTFSGIYVYRSNYCTISNSTCSSNDRCGIWLFSSHNCIIRSSRCSNNGYGGIYLYEGSSHNTLTDNICKNNIDGISISTVSDSCSISNSTCSSNEENGIFFFRSRYCTITTNNLFENRIGIKLEFSSINNTVLNNNIYNNIEYGILDSYSVNATHNWWGSSSGPYHPTENPQGEGDNVSDSVEFEPWLEEKVYWPPEANIDKISPNLAVERECILFIGHGITDASIIEYAWFSSLNGEFYNGTASEIEFCELSNGTHIIYFKVKDNYGIWSHEVESTLTVNGKPRAFIDSISPEPAEEGQPISFDGHGFDDNTIIMHHWRIGEEVLYNGPNSSFSQSNISVGNHIIHYKVQDNQGVWSEEVNTTIIIFSPTIEDTIPPSHSITSHENGEEVNGNITISGNSSDNVVVLKVEYRFAGTEDWLPVMGTIIWSIALNTSEYADSEYTLEFRAYDGKQYSEIQNLTIVVKNQEAGNGGGNGDNDGDSDEEFYAFLFEYIGPLPLLGYIGIILVVGIVGIAAGKKRKKKRSVTPGTSPQQQPQTSQVQSQQQPATQVQYQYQQQPQYPQAPQSTPQQAPVQPGGNWFCGMCGKENKGDFAFCMQCGYKRGS